ncbi:MAG TPA: glycosyltransferase [Vicinamibacteria bacterium]|nr:glycosyltransferase [Vicinamibacteria bacterium]
MAAQEACTIVARNYLPYARVLAETLRACHADCRLTVLVIDGLQAPSDSVLFRTLAFDEIVADAAERQRLAFVYDVTELSTALKPLLLRYLLEEGAESVLYFDPDIQVFTSVADLWPLARDRGILLTPHMLAPIPDDSLGVSDLYVSRAGLYNLGFLGLGAGTEAFLEWWSGRLRRHCVSAPEAGMFVDQRWIDFVPSLFPRHAILRDPGCNVAYWNLHEREVVRRDGRLEANGQPLRFFHFSGLDPSTPHLLSKHQGPNPRVLLSERPVIRELCGDYVGRLRRCGQQPVAAAYGYSTLPDGTPIDLTMRRLYREAVLEAEQSGHALPPLPFEQDVISWLNAPSPEAPRVSRYLRALHQGRPDLRAAFPSLHGEAAEAFLHWARMDPRAAQSIAERLRPQDAPSQAPVLPREGGVNIAGYLRAESGTGEVARLLTAAARRDGIPSLALVNSHSPSRQLESHALEAGRPYDVTVVCANADQLPRAIDALPIEARRGYRVGFWFWETEELPAEYRSAAELLDEIWTASGYVAEAIRNVVTKPVHVCPLPLAEPRPVSASREDLGLPSGFIFLFAFDFLSIVQRKNPIGLIDAFSRAFRPAEGPTLVIKSINGHVRRAALESVREAARGRPDIVIMDGYVGAGQRDALIGHCDCYVSLHRSEGFGLTLAEAMAQARPTIATGYSGNMAFMTPENSFLVPWRPALVPPGCEPYPAGHRWAEPDLDAAAVLMRTVYESPSLAEERGRQAAADVRTRLSSARTAAFLRERLADIARRRRPAPPAPRPLTGAERETLEAEMLLSDGITYRTHSRFGWPGRVVRTAVLRLLRPYVQHSTRVHQHHLKATQEMLDRVRSLEE